MPQENGPCNQRAECHKAEGRIPERFAYPTGLGKAFLRETFHVVQFSGAPQDVHFPRLRGAQVVAIHHCAGRTLEDVHLSRGNMQAQGHPGLHHTLSTPCLSN